LAIKTVYRKTARYPGKKTLSLTPETERKWEELSRVYKVEVVDTLRPLIDDQIDRMYEAEIRRK
jgi:hypothetical protein